MSDPDDWDDGDLELESTLRFLRERDPELLRALVRQELQRRHDRELAQSRQALARFQARFQQIAQAHPQAVAELRAAWLENCRDAGHKRLAAVLLGRTPRRWFLTREGRGPTGPM